MESITHRYRLLNILALILVLPTFYFICISVLKYNLGIDAPFDAAAPVLERLGIKESIGWNINLLIIFGPLIALAISLMQILGIEWNFTREQFNFRLAVQKRWLPLSIVMVSSLVLATLFIYLLGENCNCY